MQRVYPLRRGWRASEYIHKYFRYSRIFHHHYQKSVRSSVRPSVRSGVTYTYYTLRVTKEDSNKQASKQEQNREFTHYITHVSHPSFLPSRPNRYNTVPTYLPT